MPTQETIAEAFNRAVGLQPELCAYDTAQNGEIIANYIIENWGVGGLESSSAWEIAFAAVRDQLTPIPNFVMPLDQVTCDQLNAMTGAEVRMKYQRDPEFRKLWDQFSTQKGV